MKFSEYKYIRPNIEKCQKEIEALIDKIGGNASLEDEIKAMEEYFKIVDDIETHLNLASIRNSLDTKDEFYEKEMEFIDESMPILQQYFHAFSMKILQANNRKALEEKYGDLMFKNHELSLKTFSKEIIEEAQIENKLSTEYSKLIAGAEIDFEGEIRNLSQMSPFLQSKDRDIRRRAQFAVSKFFSDNESEIDRIYDEMVKVRDKMAKKLGYENYVQLGYDRMGRTDYNSDDVKKYRDQIFEDIVPLVYDLEMRKAKRLGIENPKSYDLALSFLSGNPTPKGDRAWQVNVARNMYKEMSVETHKFFEFMIEHELLELDSKPGKQGGGYCTFIPGYDSPFIFANFNGTAHDVDVLTHEAGHAFQAYSSKDLLPEYRWPTMDAAEIHSMSMEFLAWPWINGFFKEDTDKYKFTHLAGAVTFLPYGVTVDEFQHFVYENPNATPDERKKEWRRIEKKYIPARDYSDDPFLDKGTYWFRQGHIFGSPFYYIDYTLAQVVAFQYWIAAQENHDKALESYTALCKLGGSKSFLGLLKAANLKNPFLDGTVKEIVKPIKKYLDSVDDSKL